MSTDTQTQVTTDRQGFSWKVFAVLMPATVVCSLIILPYSFSLQSQSQAVQHVPMLATAIAAVIQGIVLTGLAAGLGLWLGPKVGLGVPALRAWLAGETGVGRRIRAALPPAVLLGLGLGAVILVVNLLTAPFIPTPLQQTAHPPAWQGFLASISAGITEEIWLRLGLMTVLVFLGAGLMRQRTQPPSGVVWVAIVLASLVFAAMHLPLAASLGSLTAIVVTYVVAANGLAGVVFGWLYWKRGLLAAMAAHFSADIVLHVIAPATGLIPTVT